MFQFIQNCYNSNHYFESMWWFEMMSLKNFFDIEENQVFSVMSVSVKFSKLFVVN